MFEFRDGMQEGVESRLMVYRLWHGVHCLFRNTNYRMMMRPMCFLRWDIRHQVTEKL